MHKYNAHAHANVHAHARRAHTREQVDIFFSSAHTHMYEHVIQMQPLPLCSVAGEKGDQGDHPSHIPYYHNITTPNG